MLFLLLGLLLTEVSRVLHLHHCCSLCCNHSVLTLVRISIIEMKFAFFKFRLAYKLPSLSSRCYNCGEFANHIAAKCTLGPQPKRCHHCKSADHLIADCPLREERKSAQQTNGTSSDTPSSSSLSADENGKWSDNWHKASGLVVVTCGTQIGWHNFRERKMSLVSWRRWGQNTVSKITIFIYEKKKKWFSAYESFI